MGIERDRNHRTQVLFDDAGRIFYRFVCEFDILLNETPPLSKGAIDRRLTRGH